MAKLIHFTEKNEIRSTLLTESLRSHHPFPPLWGKVGMGGKISFSPPPAPSPVKGEGRMGKIGGVSWRHIFKKIKTEFLGLRDEPDYLNILLSYPNTSVLVR